jgi:hypothetical protein
MQQPAINSKGLSSLRNRQNRNIRRKLLPKNQNNSN